MGGPSDDPVPGVTDALALADAAGRDLFGPARTATLDRLEREYDALCRALDALVAAGDAGRAERLIRPLRDLWWTRGRAAEGEAVSGRVLALPQLPAVDATRAALLDHAGALAVARDAPAAAREYFEAALAIRRAIGTPAEVASALHHLASVLRWKQDDPATAQGPYTAGDWRSHGCAVSVGGGAGSAAHVSVRAD